MQNKFIYRLHLTMNRWKITNSHRYLSTNKVIIKRRTATIVDMWSVFGYHLTYLINVTSTNGQTSDRLSG